jgi:hypothetical protein
MALDDARHYVVTRRKVLPDGSIALAGSWWPLPYSLLGLGSLSSAVPRVVGIIVLALQTLETLAQGRFVVAALLLLAIVFLAWPPRRVITFDRAARMVRIRHGGLVRARARRDLPLDGVRALDFTHLETVQAHDVDLLTLTLESGEQVALTAVFDGWDNRELPAELEALRSGTAAPAPAAPPAS